MRLLRTLEQFFRNRKAFAITATALFALITVLVVFSSSLFKDRAGTVPSMPESSESEASSELEDLDDNSESDSVSETQEANTKLGMPEDVCAVFLSSEMLDSGIDDALSHAADAGANTIVVSADTKSDILTSLISEAHTRNIFVCALYDVRESADEPINASLIESAALSAEHFASESSLDGIVLNAYANTVQPDSYAQYIQSGAAIGFVPYLQNQSEALYRAVFEAMTAQKDWMVGIAVQGVWENASRDASGSDTNAETTLLHDGNANIRQWLNEGRAHFVAFCPDPTSDDDQKAFEWWQRLTEEYDMPFFTLYESSLSLSEDSGNAGEENAVQATQKTEHALTHLAVTTPEQTVFSTYEPLVTFRGASDPNYAVLLDGRTVETDENGYFTVSGELEPGLNVFTLTHKDQEQTYTITRVVQIIQEVSPSENVAVEGGMKLEISALAYADAVVSASLGGVTIPLQQDNTIDDDTIADSAYSYFTGSYTVPNATDTAQSLGLISVTATWNGVSDTVEGAPVSINPIVAAGDGDLVKVIADSAKTFPTNVLNNESNPDYYPLPKGTVDYAVGDVLTFKNASGTYQYYTLQSGLRVYADDVTKIDGDLALGNSISSMKISSDKQYTYVKLSMRDPVPYRVKYSSSGISFDFQYTSSVPDSKEISGNPVLRAAEWSDSTLTLKFRESGKYLGYYAYYEDDTLVLRLTNPPLSLSGVRIAIDPGHGGKDKGAPGYYPDVSESEINAAIAALTAKELRSYGASVKLINTDPYLTLTQRLNEARAYDAQIYLSIHANSSESNPKAAGTEVFYFYSNGQQLASAISSRVANALDTSNRGAKAAQYVVTSDSRFASVLIETGFISNKTEYKKLTKSSCQSAVAEAIAEGVASYISGVSTGISGGNDSADIDEIETDDEDDGMDKSDRWQNDSSDSEISDIQLTKNDITLRVGESYRFETILTPQDADEDELVWSTDDKKIAKISSSGRVKAVSVGTTQITVSAGGKTATCIVRVKK